MPLMDEPEELLDLVDQHDTPMGTVQREQIMKMLDGTHGFVRGSGCFVVNSRNEVWLPRRLPTKKIAPNGLDLSAAEHVGAGETYEAAAARGLQEELNLAIQPSVLTYIGTVPPFTGLPYFHHIFVYHTNEAPAFNTADFVSGAWYRIDDVLELLKAGETAKVILLPSLELLKAAFLDKQ